VFLVLEHERRRIVHFNVTDGPSAQWTGQQLVNAFPDDSAPKYVIRDRDKIYGADFVRRVRAMGIEQVLTAPRSPWQNPYCERVIGTLRRDCLDHVIVLTEQHLRRILRNYLEYYHGSRTHLALGKDTPELRKRESNDGGKVIALPMVGGLHHRYARRAAWAKASVPHDVEREHELRALPGTKADAAKRLAQVEPSARMWGSEFRPCGHFRDHRGSHLATDNVLRNDSEYGMNP
jgi:hypothetical protein